MLNKVSIFLAIGSETFCLVLWGCLVEGYGDRHSICCVPSTYSDALRIWAQSHNEHHPVLAVRSKHRKGNDSPSDTLVNQDSPPPPPENLSCTCTHWIASQHAMLPSCQGCPSAWSAWLLIWLAFIVNM